jgi:hypothetical protein
VASGYDGSVSSFCGNCFPHPHLPSFWVPEAEKQRDEAIFRFPASRNKIIVIYTFEVEVSMLYITRSMLTNMD